MEFPQNDRKKYIPFRRNAAEFREKKRRHSRESGNLFGAINFRISANFTRKLILEFPHILRESLEFPRIFFCKKRGECGNLSVKMDSRFRGNDGGNPHILREKLILEFSAKRPEKVHSIPAKRGGIPQKNAVIPAKAGIHSGRLILEFPQKDRKKVHSIPAKRGGIPRKKRRHSRESGNLFGAINFRISANFTRKLILEFPHILRESLEFPRIFFCKK